VSPQDRAGVEIVVVCSSGGVWLYDVEGAGIDHLEPLRVAEWTLEVAEVAHGDRGCMRSRLCCGLGLLGLTDETSGLVPVILTMSKSDSVPGVGIGW